VYVALLSLCVLAASSGTEKLKAADDAFQGARYEEVLPALARARSAGLSLEEAARASELEAMTHAAFDDLPRARAAFSQLLRLRPDYQPDPESSPKVRALFEEAKAAQVRSQADAPVVATPLVPPPQRPPAAAPELPGLEDEQPSPQRWWIWTGAGVLVAAGIVAAIVVTKPGELPRGTLGSDSF
jgi:hypothetical protein